MKVLYIGRHPRTRHPSYWMQQVYRLRDTWYIDNRDGFFIASLRTQARVKEIDINRLGKMSPGELTRYDVIIFNHLCSFTKVKPGFDVLENEVRNLRSKLAGIPCILMLATADAGVMPSDETLDLFQLVFKREPYRDLSRYSLAGRNLDKIRPTVLSCHLVPANILNYKSVNVSEYGKRDVSNCFEHDLFFTGQDTSRQRRELVAFLKRKDISFTGGLHEDGKPLDPGLFFERLSKKDFYNMVRSSRINLAIEGYGQFTYRHWELWCLAAFMISSPSIREIQLPFEISEGEHYVAFDNFDDLLDKCRYFLDHPTERDRIALNGRKMFEEEYDFYKHGRQIITDVNRVIR